MSFHHAPGRGRQMSRTVTECADMLAKPITAIAVKAHTGTRSTRSNTPWHNCREGGKTQAGVNSAFSNCRLRPGVIISISISHRQASRGSAAAQTRQAPASACRCSGTPRRRRACQLPVHEALHADQEFGARRGHAMPAEECSVRRLSTNERLIGSRATRSGSRACGEIDALARVSRLGCRRRRWPAVQPGYPAAGYVGSMRAGTEPAHCRDAAGRPRVVLVVDLLGVARALGQVAGRRLYAGGWHRSVGALHAGRQEQHGQAQGRQHHARA